MSMLCWLCLIRIWYYGSMNFVYQGRSSDSPVVDFIWRTEDARSGRYLAAATNQLHLVFITNDQKTKVELRGTAPQAIPFTYTIGNRNLAIRLKPGVFVPGLLPRQTIDISHTLQFWESPTFDNAEVFISKLMRRGLLAVDQLVQNPTYPLQVSPRTVQRHFLRTVGLSARFSGLITRTDKAISLLQTGLPILEVAAQTGFADQAHLTRTVKQLSGRTPGQIIKKAEDCRLRSIPGYGPCAEMKVQNIELPWPARLTQSAQ